MDVECYECGEYGHYASDCPNGSGMGGGGKGGRMKGGKGKGGKGKGGKGKGGSEDLNAWGKGKVRGSESSEVPVFVSNLPHDFDWRNLKDLLNEDLDIAHANMGPNGNSHGFGVVKLHSLADALKAVEILDGSSIDGQLIEAHVDRKLVAPQGGKAEDPQDLIPAVLKAMEGKVTAEEEKTTGSVERKLVAPQGGKAEDPQDLLSAMLKAMEGKVTAEEEKTTGSVEWITPTINQHAYHGLQNGYFPIGGLRTPLTPTLNGWPFRG